MLADVAAPEAVRVRRSGTFGVLPAEVATPLAMVVTELLQNALEHGYTGLTRGGVVELVAARAEGGGLAVEVRDDGRGLPAGFRPEASGRLGLQIVRTLVEGELGGRLLLGPVEGGGTCVRVEVAVPAG
jgi:two-component sensor histidine kinase